jgi:TolA-binding protein
MEKHRLYMEKIDGRLVQYNAKLAQMKGRVIEVNADMKLEYLEQINKFEKERDVLIKQHEQLKTASIHGWDDIKVGTEKAWDELEGTFDKVVRRFKY